MNYRHIFHAGNFADVFKHTILTSLILALQRKDKACCYFDTHAGIGFYDLSLPVARRSGEYKEGIARIFDSKTAPPIVTAYLSAIKDMNKESNGLHYYPGSPVITHKLLRPQDRMVLSELHPDDHLLLNNTFYRDNQVAVHQLDGYQLLKAFLPPKERRGLVLIDPPFEDKAEFKNIVAALRMSLKLWETGVYAIWYPIKDRLAVRNFLRQLQRSVTTKILLAELLIMPENAPLQLKGCGMVIINPPWQLEQQLQPEVQWLWQHLAPTKEGRWQVEWLRA
ncbi:23S rRNA (adenine(2030)-N(6))-methyltransferase RlmJ [soil metagenome]